MLEPDKLKINVRIDMRHLLGHEIHVCLIFEVFVELDNVRVVLLETKDADENKCIKFRNYYCEKDSDKIDGEGTRHKQVAVTKQLCHAA